MTVTSDASSTLPSLLPSSLPPSLLPARPGKRGGMSLSLPPAIPPSFPPSLPPYLQLEGDALSFFFLAARVPPGIEGATERRGHVERLQEGVHVAGGATGARWEGGREGGREGA